MATARYSATALQLLANDPASLSIGDMPSQQYQPSVLPILSRYPPLVPCNSSSFFECTILAPYFVFGDDAALYISAAILHSFSFSKPLCFRCRAYSVLNLSSCCPLRDARLHYFKYYYAPRRTQCDYVLSH